MPTIQFIATDGSVEEHDANVGSTVMQVAVMQGVRGIKADCGGACECATCHVYVDPAWIDRLPAPQRQEQLMLDGTAAPRLPTSRLSCQLTMSDELDGIVVRLPEGQ
ncbi:MAG: ferredoxin [Leptothrix sp. (in: Bacteria)]|nr:ferredoxin [Leptothrix sp. (in: b-proteobacteria)]